MTFTASTKVLVTGANIGLGKDAARQLALRKDVTKVVLGCRSEEKGLAAVLDLEKATGRKIFQVLIMDVTDADSVRKAVQNLAEPIDGLVLNAGGMGGTTPAKLTKMGVTLISATNVLGHVILVEELIKQNKLVTGGSVVFSGTEGISGVPAIMMERAELKDNGSVEELVSFLTGAAYTKKTKPEDMYSRAKLVGALWMSHMARQHASIRFVTISPGMTTGTNIANNIPFLTKIMFKWIAFPMMALLGKSHGVDVGAKRYVDALYDHETYKTGTSYCSQKGVTGKVIDQAKLYSVLSDKTMQGNASAALSQFPVAS